MNSSMRSSPVEDYRYPHESLQQAQHVTAIAPAAIVDRNAANEQTVTSARVTNPLWAINIGMLVFFVSIALILMFS